MLGNRSHTVFIFLLSVSIIMARPVLLFLPSAVQTYLVQEVKTYGFSKTLRKRKETNNTTDELALAEFEVQTFQFLPIQLLLSTLRSWQHRLLLLLSFLFAYLLASNRSIRRYFDLRPQNDRYKTIAVFLI